MKTALLLLVISLLGAGGTTSWLRAESPGETEAVRGGAGDPARQAAPAEGGPRVIGGPMLGDVEHRSAMIWLEAAGTKRAAVRFQPAGAPDKAKEISLDAPPTTLAGGQIYKFTLTPLEPGMEYDYTVLLDGAAETFPFALKFKTKTLWEWRTAAPDVRFLVGSCCYLNDAAYDRPGKPYGQGDRIYELMAERGGDFFLWLGDNWYYREVDYSSPAGMWLRAQYNRSHPDLRKLMAVMPHIATWDDHDYGPNDSNSSFVHKDAGLDIFNAYWCNPSHGTAEEKGVFTEFRFGDAAFFLLDDRWKRDADELDEAANPEKTQLGREQIGWLKNALIYAQSKGGYRSTFKFIGVGGQFFNDFEYGGFTSFRKEREELVDFIGKQGITGVVFLSGDRHFTELSKRERPGAYPLYELTSSPLSSGAATGVEKSPEKDDPLTVAGTRVMTQNWCEISVLGPPKARKLLLVCYDKTGAKQWEREITAAELGAAFEGR